MRPYVFWMLFWVLFWMLFLDALFRKVAPLRSAMTYSSAHHQVLQKRRYELKISFLSSDFVVLILRSEEGQWIIIHVQVLSFPLEILEAHASFLKQTLWTELPAPSGSSRKLKTPLMTM
ncbi:hypothetical protein ACN42_g4231 [Penicillium freii]|uniref:Uncharacterized protein n=1 Tax=Penicillium freii TaxID=48697 RepID=A0A101MLQ5_PENFR|nr:hypothetical protein ACN42_g4231 [Penicillium freii]